MADYFEKGSFIIPIESYEEMSWLNAVVDAGCAWDDERDLSYEENEHTRGLFEYLSENDRPLQNTYVYQEARGERYLWVSGDEVFDVEEAALLAQAFLRHFNKDKLIAFQWSQDCSRPKVDAYGGGACVVSAKRYELVSTMQMVDRLINKMDGGVES